MKLLAAIFLALAFMAPTAQAGSRILVLSEADEAAYAQAFELADRGAWTEARDALRRVSDTSLVDHVEARALLSTDKKPTRDRFVSFLSRNPTHVHAWPVYRRAQALRAKRLPTPATQRGRIPNDAGRTSSGARADSVALAFGSGDFAGARMQAQLLIEGPSQGAASWWLGLISWREAAFDEAAHWFAASAEAAGQSGWDRSAGHYWQARALTAAGRTAEAVTALHHAAEHAATFYGQLAEAQLGRESALDFSILDLDQTAASSLLSRFPEAYRAAALAQIGELSDSERELAALHNRSTRDDDRLQLALAVALEAPGAQLRVAEYGGPEVAAGYCPATTFEPADGFRFDRAVLYAIVRQESRFSPIAVSRSNARGLMQLLPSTAQDLDASQSFRRAPNRLHDPALNMALGQRYVEWLDASYQKGGDLARIFAAYNGGPNWLVRWEQSYPPTEDPLLWLESLPRWESRDYAERVLSHMALCRKRFGQEAWELSEMARGGAPIYRPMDK